MNKKMHYTEHFRSNIREWGKAIAKDMLKVSKEPKKKKKK